MTRTLERRVARLERCLQASQREKKARKRACPDWLQASMESEGFVFDQWGQVNFSPFRSARPEPSGWTMAKVE